ncbi:MAG: hypothetical protein EZS28_017342 [Streblomastix strix]|uniref:Uncharacterized protein n=1 Tax=Streblomastix strix TaxID=222440 RepID=A0A5J4VWX2_9EUKA|nr:MAG: hypothetical protein EZS28_017342 [Streblomastix strix]
MKNKNNWDSFVLTGCYADPTDRDGVWKVGSTSSQFRKQKQEDQAYDQKIVSPLPDPLKLYATQYSIAQGIYEQRIWGTLTSVRLIYLMIFVFSFVILMLLIINQADQGLIQGQLKDPTAITWRSTRADLSKQLGLYAQNNIVFLL